MLASKSDSALSTFDTFTCLQCDSTIISAPAPLDGSDKKGGRR